MVYLEQLYEYDMMFVEKHTEADWIEIAQQRQQQQT